MLFSGNDDAVGRRIITYLYAIAVGCVTLKLARGGSLFRLLSGSGNKARSLCAGLPVQTFTIGFHDKAVNEAPEAAATARILETDHHEINVSEWDLLDTIPALPSIYDEPGPSQIPTTLVSRLARQHVTVALHHPPGQAQPGDARWKDSRK